MAAATRKRRCKHGRSKVTGKCKKAPARKKRSASSGEWTAARVKREEAYWDRVSPGWRDYGEEGPSRSRPFGRVASRRRSSGRSRRRR